ncbi:MAG: PIN domain-containing protein [Candidatus Uhrbacteria bacterium]|nr:PIN domain-containing protein [Candidatus Uhrbacteria bacterium]
MELAAIPYLIDANVYLGYVNEHDSLHDQADEVITNHLNAGSTFILLDHIIQEIATVLLYRREHEILDSFIKSLSSDEKLFIVDTPIIWLENAVVLAKKQSYQPKISMTDWLLLSRSIITGAPILTFDKQLLAASKKLC